MAKITNRLSALFDNTINNALMKSANDIAEEARRNAPTARISKSIEVSQVMDTPDGKRIKISVSLDKDKGAPEARAYELGSGIHGEFGTTYPINAKNVPNLVFFWQKKNAWFVGPHVDHPGVAAKPYLAPAVVKNRASIRGTLTRGLISLVRAAIRTGFTEK